MKRFLFILLSIFLFSCRENKEKGIEFIPSNTMSLILIKNPPENDSILKLNIKEYLEKTADRSSIYLSLDTLKYLKKGGRITPAAAAIGTLLNLKPVLQIQGDKLDAYAKCRGKAQAKKTMIEAIRKDMETRFKKSADKHNLHLALAYGGNLEEALIIAIFDNISPDYKKIKMYKNRTIINLK